MSLESLQKSLLAEWSRPNNRDLDKIGELLKQVKTKLTDDDNFGKFGQVSVTFYPKIARILIATADNTDGKDEIWPFSDFISFALRNPCIPEHTLVSLIHSVVRMLEKADQTTQKSIVSVLIQSDPPLLETLPLQQNKVKMAVITLLTRLFDQTHFDVLQLTYSCVASRLTEIASKFRSVNVSKSIGSFADVRSNRDTLLVYVASLKPLASVKNNLFVLMGLSPSLFSLLFDILPLSDGSLSSLFPMGHLAAVSLAKFFTETHDFFVSSSEWLNEERTTLHGYHKASTSTYLSKIIGELAALLRLASQLTPDATSAVFDWINSLVSRTEDYSRTLLQQPEMIQLRTTLLELLLDYGTVDQKCFKQLAHATRRLDVGQLLENKTLSTEQTESLLKKFICLSRSISAEAFSDLWQNIPNSLLIRCGLSPIFSLTTDSLQLRLGSNYFSPQHFRIVCNFIIGQAVPSFLQDPSKDNEWVQLTPSYIRNSCDTSLSIADNADITENWRAVLTALAQFCVENRMRTPFGKPLDTFTKFENEIRGLVSAAVSRSSVDKYAHTGEQNVPTEEPKSTGRHIYASEDEDEEPTVTAKKDRKLLPVEEWFRVRLLLEFIETLDKAMFYAIRGSMFPIWDVSASAHQFFQTNYSSCHSWLQRMRLPLMAVAYLNGNYAQTVRIASAFLFDLQKATKAGQAVKLDASITLAICWLVRALVELKSTQSIRGIKRWMSKMFDASFDWIENAAQLAGGRVETALEGINECLMEENLDDHVAKTLEELRLKAIKCLRSSEHMSNAQNDIMMKAKPSGNGESAAVTYRRMQTERAIALSSWKVVDNGYDPKGRSYPWELQDRLDEFEMDLLNKTQRHLSMGPKQAAQAYKGELTNMSQELARMTRHVMLAEDSPIFFNRMVTLRMTIRLLQHRMSLEQKRTNYNTSTLNNVPVVELDPTALLKDWKLNPLDRLEMATQLSTWLERCYPQNNPMNSSAHSVVSILARKTGNPKLSLCHLRKILPTELIASPSIPPYGVSDNFDIHSPQGAFTGVSTAPPPGFPAGAFVGNMVPKPDIHLALHAAKLHWQEPIFDGTNERYESFVKLANCVCHYMDDYTMALESHKSLDAPYMGQNGTRSHFGYGKRQPPSLNPLVTKACIYLGQWASSVPNPAEMLIREHAAFPRLFYQQLFQTTETLLQKCLGIDAINALKGAFHMIAADHGTVAKAHKALADWSMQVNTSEVYGESDIVRISPGENVMLSQLNVDILSSDGKELLRLISKYATAEEMQNEALSTSGFKDKELMENVMNSNDFWQLWNVIKRRQFNLFEVAVKSYIRFLETTATSRNISVVSTSLSVLQMIAQHSEWFSVAVERDWIERCNEDVWKDIIPQLFARLSHPQAIVRDIIRDLLVKIGQTSPHAVCFPAVVSANAYGTNSSPTDEDDPEVGQLTTDFDATDLFGSQVDCTKSTLDLSVMNACCRSIVASLENMFPELIHDVIQFTQELQKVTLLHEEKWHFVLSNMDHEVMKRIRQLEHEKSKASQHKHLDEKQKQSIHEEKTTIAMGIICQILEDLYQKTCACQPNTANEKQFLAMYHESLTNALETFRNNRFSPAKAWQPFKKILETLNQRAIKKSSLCLHTSDMSPYLALMSGTKIPVPGQELSRYQRDDKSVATIHKMHKMAYVLPTKTRPKKITFTRSDGKEYAFLFKGQEDLHLDERVMQLLHICNLMLESKRNPIPSDWWPTYRAKNYSVTPLGTRSGLIQWVDGAIPLFQVYRKWKSRKLNTQQTKEKPAVQAKEGSKNWRDYASPLRRLMAKEKAAVAKEKKPVVPEERPMEMFYRLLKAILQSNGLTSEIINDRQRWPTTALEQVLQQLQQETPQDILARELWMNSGNCMSWWRITQRFARDTAVMSMVGSVMGLGDRHLDNILVNFTTGNVVHVDYNVSFEKGKNLRVPETVPCRLTGNIVTALGPTGTEGIFRESCEHVLSVVRDGKTVLLQMLEAFIYDPLVDWSVQDQVVSATSVNIATVLAVYGTDHRAEIALPLTQAMFRLRVKEMKAQWMSICNKMEESLRKVSQILNQMHEYSSISSADDAKIRYEKERVEAGGQLRIAITQHHQLMQLFRPLLRSLARVDSRYGAFLRSYKEKFSEPLVRGHKLLDEKDANYGKCVEFFQSVIMNIQSIHCALLELEAVPDVKAPVGRVIIDANTPVTPGDVLSSITDLQTEVKQPEEQENLHAKAISKRIERKLDGFEIINALPKKHACRGGQPTVETPKMTPSEQVDFLINEATSISNLALMYEGWTAWV